MRLKSFQAETMTEAMALVREALGEDAIIVSTREDKQNHLVRVTAAIEQFEDDALPIDFGDTTLSGLLASEDDEDELDLLADDEFIISDDGDLDIADPFNDWQPEDNDIRRFNHLEDDKDIPSFAIRDEHAEEDILAEDDYFDFDLERDAEGQEIEIGIVEPIIEALLRHNLPANVTDAVVTQAIESDAATPRDALKAALRDIFTFDYLPDDKTAKPIILIGPPGSGKTMTVAKLAARVVMNDLECAVITTDTARAGGVEQLSAFTKLLNIDLMQADDPASLAESIALCAKADQILIDTSGINPFNATEVKELAGLLKAIDADPVLVLPAGGDSSESADIARAFALLGAKKLLPTRMDIARRIGGIMAAAWQAKLAICEASNTAHVADGLIRINADDLSKILIPDAYNKKT